VAELVQRALRESGRTGPESAATSNGGSHAHAAAAVAGIGAATALVAFAARHRAH